LLLLKECFLFFALLYWLLGCDANHRCFWGVALYLRLLLLLFLGFLLGLISTYHDLLILLLHQELLLEELLL